MNPKYRKRGKEAFNRGKEAEKQVDASLDRYASDGNLVWTPTYPEVKKLKDGIRYTGKGATDRIVSYLPSNTSTPIPIWFEIKCIYNRPGTHQLSRVHQCQLLQWHSQIGGWAFYLILWQAEENTRREAINEWRLHPVHHLESKTTVTIENGLVRVTRKTGLEVPFLDNIQYDFQGWDVQVRDLPFRQPEWLKVAQRYYL